MKFTESITENRIYRQMYNRAQNVVCKNIVVYLRRNRFGINRLGLTCTKTVGKAVERNRAKRLMREAYRLNEDKLGKGYDIVIVARTRAKDARFCEVEKDFLFALKRLSSLLGEKR